MSAEQIHANGSGATPVHAAQGNGPPREAKRETPAVDKAPAVHATERAERPAAAEVATNEVKATDAQPKAADAAKVKEAAKELNDVLDSLNKGIRFNVNDDTGDVVVQVVDRASDEVIRQFPSEEVVRLRSHIHDLVGMLLDSQG